MLSLCLLNNLLIFHPSITYSLFFPLKTPVVINNHHLITLNAYLLSITQPYLYYRGCWHRFLPGLILFRLIMISKFLIVSYFPLTGSNFRSLPNIPHCCQREFLFKKKVENWTFYSEILWLNAKDHWHGGLHFPHLPKPKDEFSKNRKAH